MPWQLGLDAQLGKGDLGEHQHHTLLHLWVSTGVAWRAPQNLQVPGCALRVPEAAGNTMESTKPQQPL
jgi:hypothetical protein